MKLAMACTKDLMRSQPQRFRAFTEHVLLRLLSAARDPASEVALDKTLFEGDDEPKKK